MQDDTLETVMHSVEMLSQKDVHCSTETKKARTSTNAKHTTHWWFIFALFSTYRR